MGRWRPPQQRGSKYITREGAEKLQAELTQLWKVERPQVTATVHEAAKNGYVEICEKIIESVQCKG